LQESFLKSNLTFEGNKMINPNIHSISKKSLKYNLKNTFKGEISEKGYTYIFELLLKIINNLSENIVGEFEEYNQRRIQHGLPRLKRLNKYVIKRCLDNIFKQYVDNINGEKGERNKELSYQDDTLNSKNRNCVIEDAGIEVV
jgi:hypothetical protein